MSLLLFKKPRVLASMAFESFLVMGVLYVVATLNDLVSIGDGVNPAHYAVAGGGFTVLLGVIGIRLTFWGNDARARREVVLLSAFSAIVAAIAVLVTFAFFRSSAQLPALILESVVVVPVSMTAWRYVATRFDLLDAGRERVLVIGSGELARRSGRWIVDHLDREYSLVGFADHDASRVGEIVAMGIRIQTGFDGLADYCTGNADRILVALDEKRGKFPIQKLMELRLRGVEIEDVVSFFERTTGKIPVEEMTPSWIIFSDGFKVSPLRSALKRASDIGLSLVVLVLAAPLMLLVAAAIRMSSAGPILYRQRRVGLNRREFDMLKFRSMVNDAEKSSGPTWADRDDSRITRVGRVIRKLRLDELPQLINVLRGEMSLVGPRPERPHFVRQLEERIPYYGLRMVVRPGITGWAQVRYRYGATVEDALEKLKFDLFYIKHCGIVLDVWIVLKTFKVVLFATGAR